MRLTASEKATSTMSNLSSEPVANLLETEKAATQTEVTLENPTVITLQKKYLVLRWWAIVPSQALQPTVGSQFIPKITIDPAIVNRINESIKIIVTDYNASIGPIGTNTVPVTLNILNHAGKIIYTYNPTLSEDNASKGTFVKVIALDGTDLNLPHETLNIISGFKMTATYQYNYNGNPTPVTVTAEIKISRREGSNFNTRGTVIKKG